MMVKTTIDMEAGPREGPESDLSALRGLLNGLAFSVPIYAGLFLLLWTW